jgi:hypothetical protein
MQRLANPAKGRLLTTIQFDIQLRFLAKEIKIVNAQRMLTVEFVAAESPGAQPAPHELFHPSVIAAKLPGALDFGHVRNLGNGA